MVYHHPREDASVLALKMLAEVGPFFSFGFLMLGVFWFV